MIRRIEPHAAGPLFSGTFVLADEGAILGSVEGINLVGDNVEAVVSGSYGHVEVTGDAAVTGSVGDWSIYYAFHTGTPVSPGQIAFSGLTGSMVTGILCDEWDVDGARALMRLDRMRMNGLYISVWSTANPLKWWMGQIERDTGGDQVGDIVLSVGYQGHSGGDTPFDEGERVVLTAGFRELAIYDDGVFQVNASALDFGANLDVSTSGSHVTIDGQAGGGGNPPTTGSIVVFDEGVILGSVLGMNFTGDNVEAVVSGSYAHIMHTGTAGGGGGSPETGSVLWDGWADWTPIWSAATAVGNNTGTFARYLHEGHRVQVFCHIFASGTSANGTFEVGGLPLPATSLALANTSLRGYGRFFDEGTAFYDLQIRGQTSTSVRFTALNNFASYTDAIDADDHLAFHLIYETDEYGETLVSGSFLTDFLSLTDTPASYSGQSGSYVRVSDDETGLEFSSPSPALATGIFNVEEILYEVSLGSATGSVIIPGISQDYDHLRLIIIGRGDQAAAQVLDVEYNGDTTAANYFYGAHVGSIASHAVLEGDSQDQGVIVGTDAGADVFGHNEISILGYTQSKHKVSSGIITARLAAGDQRAYQWTQSWENTAAINRIDITPAVGNFNTDSFIQLIGIRQRALVTGYA